MQSSRLQKTQCFTTPTSGYFAPHLSRSPLLITLIALILAVTITGCGSKEKTDEKSKERTTIEKIEYPGPDRLPEDLQISEKWTAVFDRPFIFAIRDNRTGVLLFIGQVTDPRKH